MRKTMLKHTRHPVSVPALAAALAVVFFLSGCGQTNSVASSSLRGGERSSSVQGVTVTPSRADTEAYEAFRLVNEERLRRGMLPLARRPDLDAIAMDHARDLFRMNRLSHVGSNGSKLENRMGNRVNWIRAGENLARNKGFPSPSREAVRGWIASPKHYENMFRPDFCETGMAAVYDPDTDFTYIVQIFMVPA